MEPMLVLLALLLVISACQTSSPDFFTVRTWQTNINFNNSRNWNIGRVPCDTDRVILQSSESIVLEVPEGKTSLRELVLPAQTEILLPKDGVIQFTGKTYSSSCDGKDAVFKPTQASRWMDPKNWDHWNSATPDLERVPCTTDHVQFPSGATYRVIMPGFEIKVGSLQIGEQLLDSFDWFRFANSDGFRQFYKPNNDIPEIKVVGRTCPISRWCECGNDYLNSEICSNPCPLPYCKLPVKPSGFCCPICGAYMLLETVSENKNVMTRHITSFLRDKNIVWHASKSGEYVQVVLVAEGEYTEELADIATDLKKFLIGSGQGWMAHEFHASGHVWYPTTFGDVVGKFLLLMVLAAFSLAVTVVYYSYDWKDIRRTWLQFPPVEGRPFVFARFENQSGEVVVASEQRPDAPALPQAFDNPMYGATGQEQRNVTVENPVFTKLEEDCSDNQPLEEGMVLGSTNFSGKTP